MRSRDRLQLGLGLRQTDINAALSFRDAGQQKLQGCRRFPEPGAP